MKQHLLSKGLLLDNNGNLNEAGYAFDLVKTYERKAIKASRFRIKEWDYYYIGDENFGIALTVADNSYMALMSVSVLDFKNKTESTKSYMKWFTFGKLSLPSSSADGDIEVKNKKYHMHFINEHGKRRLVCYMKNVSKGKDFSCDISLTPTNNNSMVIAIPFNKKHHFYYNQKINNLFGVGSFTFGSFTYSFSSSYGVLDWGRGVWTYSNTWYWSSLNSEYQGHKIGFNLGYGFGDTSNASENMLFIDKEAYKLDDVTFDIPKDKGGKDDFLKPWNITSANHDIDLVFTPLINRKAKMNALILESDQNQIFGLFTGTFTIKGETIRIDNLLGFAEKVKNRW